MKNRVTITDLAKAAGVSVSTVDRIINKRGPVQRVTAEHVLAVAQKVGFTGVPSLRHRLSEDAPVRTFGFLLNRRERALYGSFSKALVDSALALTNVRAKTIVRHIEDMTPHSVADALLELAEECDCIAGVCIEHPRVNQAIRELAEKSIPFWALLSDVSSPERAGFIGTNGWKLGRSAGWFMARLCPPHSKIAVLLGAEQYLCQKEYEAGFLNYLKEADCTFILIPATQTFEDDNQSYQLTTTLLRDDPEIGGLLMSGGGIDGVVKALREFPNSNVRIVSTEISEMTPQHLLDEVVDVALSHEFGRVAELAVKVMEFSVFSDRRHVPQIHSVPMKVLIRENL